MSFRPSLALKSAATELAMLIATRDPDRQRLELLMRLLTPPGNGNAEEKVREPRKSQEEEHIGIWKRVGRNGQIYYMRDTRITPEWPFWADVHEIAPKGGKKRIVLIGESVARGYFYDPYYTVAGELDGILKKVAGFPAAEVIDLAKTGLDMFHLRRLIRSCPALEPDAVVLFAGNNWATDKEGDMNKMFADIYEAYRRASFRGAKSLPEKKLKDLVTDLLKEVADVLVSRGIPVLFVIPEFNLCDWKSDEFERIPLRLSGDGLSRWVDARKEAESVRDTGEAAGTAGDTIGAAAAGDMAGAAAAAKALLDLDPSNPLGYEILGDCYIREHRWPEARILLESARDTALLSRGRSTKPRCYTVIQDTLRQEAARHGIGIVDLPFLFDESKEAPGRELFLDYCHLTLKGIRIAMSGVAARLIEVLGGHTPGGMPVSGIMPSRKVLGITHFCAAIHNAHQGQPIEIVRYHCREAIAFFPQVRQLMYLFADFSSRTASSIFCSRFEELIIEGELRQYEGGMGLAHPKARKLIDIELVDAMAAAAGEGLERKVYELRIREHGLSGTKKDLLEPFYGTTSYNDFLTRLKPLFLQCRAVTGFFYFVVEEGPVGFELVYRTPAGSSGQGSVDIGVNGAENIVARLAPAEKWSTATFTVDAPWLNRGVNRLYITWPAVAGREEGQGRPSDHDLFNVLFPPLGEISALTACVIAAPVVKSRSVYLQKIEQ